MCYMWYFFPPALLRCDTAVHFYFYCVWCLQSVWKRSWPKATLTCSVMLVVVGCIIAGIGDLAFDARAYAFAFSSVITQALYLLLVEFQASCGWLRDC